MRGPTPSESPVDATRSWRVRLFEWTVFPVLLGGVIALLTWRLTTNQPIAPIQTHLCR